MYGKQLYISLNMITAGLLMLLIIMGVLVRVGNAEAGCNYTWPLCNNALIPALDNHTIWLDWGHRLITFLAAILMFGTLETGRYYLRHESGVMQPLYLCVGLFIIQALLGALTMVLPHFPALALLHLGLAMLMLSGLVASLTALVYTPPLNIKLDNLPTTIHATTLMTFLVLLTGAIVVASNASTACGTFPLCHDPSNDLHIINLLHRGCVLMLGFSLVSLLARVQPPLRSMVLILVLLYVVQAAIGALYIFREFNQAMRALHVIFASITWTAAVVLSTITLKHQEQ